MEKFVLEMNQSETRIACGGPGCLKDRTKKEDSLDKHSTPPSLQFF